MMLYSSPPRTFVFQLAATILTVAFTPSQGHAQAAKGTMLQFSPFYEPSPGIVCDARVADAEDPRLSAVVVSFSDGEDMVNRRLVDAGYNASGKAEWVAITAQQSLGDVDKGVRVSTSFSFVIHGFWVVFPSTDSAVAFHVPGLQPPESIPDAVGRSIPVDKKMTAAALHLANRLWLLQCAETARSNDELHGLGSYLR